MPLPDTATLCRDLPIGEGGVVEFGRRLTAACVEALGRKSAEFWIWRAVGEPNGPGEPLRQLELVARAGSECLPLRTPEMVARELEGAVDERAVTRRLIARTDAAHESRLLVGETGVLVLLGDQPLAPPHFEHLLGRMSEFADAVVARLPAADLAEVNRWLIERGKLDRRAARAFAKVRTVQELAHTIDEFCGWVAPATYSGLYFIEPESGKFRLYFARGLTEDERAAAERTAMERHPGLVMRTGDSIDIPDLEFLDEAARRMPPGHGREVRARLFLPVQSEGRTVGTIGFAGPEPWSFSHRHRQYLAFLADFAGLAYGRIEAEAKSSKRGRLLEAAAVASERLLGAVDWRPAAYAALALAGDALGAATVALIQRETADALVDGARPVEFVWQPLFGEPWSHAERLMRLSAAEIERLLRDESLDMAFEVEGGRATRRATVKPVLVDGELWGVVACEAREGMPALDRVDRLLLRSLAGQFATALGRERLFGAAQQKASLEAVGQLAAGIASDFNELLWPILLYTEVLGREGKLDERGRDMIDEMHKSARSASELVQQVLAISRRGDRMVELVRPAQLVDDLAQFLRRTAPPAVRIEADIDADSGHLLGDPASLFQSLLTLGTNAVEAVGPVGGTVVLSVGLVESAGRRWVRMAVRDNGPGLSESMLSHIFDPYFGESVEGAQGMRSGLGLSLVRQHVASMDGRVSVSSKPGAGTEFVMLFPKVAQSSDEDSVLPAPVARDPQEPPRSRVLFVDDDMRVLAVVQDMLEAVGYSVVACANPAEALEKIPSSGACGFDLVLTDLTMPGMNGIELAREIRRRGIRIPIVCCTGHVDPGTERIGFAAGMCAIVRKPVQLEVLATTLRDALAGGSGDGDSTVAAPRLL